MAMASARGNAAPGSTRWQFALVEHRIGDVSIHRRLLRFSDSQRGTARNGMSSATLSIHCSGFDPAFACRNRDTKGIQDRSGLLTCHCCGGKWCDDSGPAHPAEYRPERSRIGLAAVPFVS